MRQLTKEQKMLLDKWFSENKHRNLTLFFSIDNCDYFSVDLYDKLQMINDTEILYRNINNYISDKVGKEMHR